MLVSELFEIAAPLVDQIGGVTARDIVALAAFRCGGLDKNTFEETGDNELLKCDHGYNYADFDGGLYRVYRPAFGSAFSEDQFKILCSKVGFMPYPLTLLQYFIQVNDGQIPVSEWWETAEKIIAYPIEQIKLCLPRLQSAITKAKSERYLAFSYFFEPDTSQITIKGSEVAVLYYAFKNKQKATNERFPGQ